MKTDKDDWMAPIMVRLPREDKSKGLGTMSIAFGVGLVAGLWGAYFLIGHAVGKAADAAGNAIAKVIDKK